MKKIIIVLVIITVLLSACTDQKTKEETTTEEKVDDSDTLEPIKSDDVKITFDKPVIYLYPDITKDIDVILDFDGKLDCTYPEYQNGWEVTAYPDGRLINKSDNLEYSYLFWEGSNDYKWDIESGFVIKGDEAAEFLKNKLSFMGLIPKEYNEFIVYWLPIMKKNPYNLVYFATEEYTKQAKLTITPKPDSILRIYMIIKGLNEPIDIQEQRLNGIIRKGFTVVEWGGTEIQ